MQNADHTIAPTTLGERAEPARRTNVHPVDFLRYRGGPGMVAWTLHRLTGLGILAFFLAHVVDTSLIGWAPAVYDAAIALYRGTLFRIGEILLFGAVLYHAVNGLRIVIIDFWPQTTRLHRRLFWGVIGVFFVLFIPAAAYMALGMLRP
jgi:succinate dehydrogenase / fumarate reductase cytochrome b subunit